MKGVCTVLYKQQYDLAVKILNHPLTMESNVQGTLDSMYKYDYALLIEHINTGDNVITRIQILNRAFDIEKSVIHYKREFTKRLPPSEYINALDESYNRPF